MYADGEGVHQNYTLAAKWYGKAAEHVPISEEQSRQEQLGAAIYGWSWRSEGLCSGVHVVQTTNFETNLSYAKAQMTPAQVLEAERMAAEWKSHHPER